MAIGISFPRFIDDQVYLGEAEPGEFGVKLEVG